MLLIHATVVKWGCAYVCMVVLAHVMWQSGVTSSAWTKVWWMGFVEIGGFRMAPRLTAVSLYVIACMRYYLAMWSVFSTPHNAEWPPPPPPNTHTHKRTQATLSRRWLNYNQSYIYLTPSSDRYIDCEQYLYMSTLTSLLIFWKHKFIAYQLVNLNSKLNSRIKRPDRPDIYH